MKRTIAWLVGIIVVGAAGWTLLGVTPQKKKAVSSGNPECPHAWESFLVRAPQKGGGYSRSDPLPDTEGPGTVVPAPGALDAPYGFSLPNPISDVPEYHDCQRMRVVDGGIVTYGSLIAVFANPSLDSMPAAVFKTPQTVVEVFVSEPGGYRPLRIRNTFSCLVLQRDEKEEWRAWMVPVQRQKQCTQAFTVAQFTADMALRVVASSPPAGGTVPSVARWDWDAEGNRQYIGVRCGSQWCEVGFGPLTPSAAYSAGATTGPEAANITIKGYYDEQRLAEFPAGGGIRPGENTGTVVPSPTLATTLAGGRNAYNGRWRHVADVYMRPDAGSYAKSLNFVGDVAPPPKAMHAQVSLCRGGPWRCRPSLPKLFFRPSCHPSSGDGEIWYAKIDQDGKRPRYYCVVYRAHEGHQIPPVTRWRWRVDDESIWVSCPDGCCETNVDQFTGDDS